MWRSLSFFVTLIFSWTAEAVCLQTAQQIHLPAFINLAPIFSQAPVYYPDSPVSGFPYILYYKIPNSPSFSPAIHDLSTALSECAKTVQPNELGDYFWFGPWPPMRTPAPYLILLPSLVHVEEE